MEKQDEFQLIGVWPIQSAIDLAISIDELCEPVYLNQFTIITGGGICLNNGQKDAPIKLYDFNDPDFEPDELKLISYAISCEFYEKLTWPEQSYFWVKHAIENRLDVLQMMHPEFYLEPADIADYEMSK